MKKLKTAVIILLMIMLMPHRGHAQTVTKNEIEPINYRIVRNIVSVVAETLTNNYLPRLTLIVKGHEAPALNIPYSINLEVTGIINGNTLNVNNSHNITLAGIELTDDNTNTQLKAYLDDKILGKEINIEYDSNDSELAYVYINGVMLNCQILRDGMVKLRTLRKLDHRTYLSEAYEYAKANRIGVHHVGLSTVEPSLFINPYIPYTHKQMLVDIDNIQKMYPELINVETIGKSVEGRDITLVKLGKGEIKLHMNGSFHAREYIGTTVLMKMLEEYSYAYYTGETYEGYDLRSILDKVTIYIVPMVNPDGVNIAQNGNEAAEDPDKVSSYIKMNPFRTIKDSNGNPLSTPFDYSYWKTNANGVDLNNQFESGYGEWERFRSTPGPASESFKGYTSFSEPEVIAIKDLIETVDFSILAALHTKGQIIYWSDFTVDEEQMKVLKPMAQGLAEITGYDLVPSSNEQQFGTGFSNYVRGALGKHSFTIELCPPGLYASYDDSLFDLEWERVKTIGAYLSEESIKIENNNIELENTTDNATN